VSAAVLSYQLNESSTTKLSLKGSAIGNGLTDPPEQYKWYLPFAAEHGLVSDNVQKMMAGFLDACENLIDGCNNASSLDVDDDKMIRYDEWQECLTATIVCNLGEITPVTRTGVNPYDVRIPCGDSKICYDFSNVDAYMNQPDVMAAFGVPPNRKWKECKSTVEEVLVGAGDWMKEFQTSVAYLLENKMNVLIYAGEYDFICNYMGNLAWTKTLEWSGAEAFNNAVNTTWMPTESNADGAGSYITAQGFTFLKVKNAGHMVPMDQPYNALEMLRSHVNGFWKA
jgi:cathepsin A (carboxypeptidase C)